MGREQFVTLLDTQPLRRGDVIFVLQGDGLNRAAHAATLFREGFAPLVTIVGNATDRSYGSFPSSEVRDEMIRLGVTQEAMHFEEVAPHTRTEADRAMQLAAEKKWKTILILTSPHHQYRAFLTFLKAMRDVHLALTLINAPAPLSMSEENPWGTRADLLKRDLAKIAAYQERGDVASYEDGIAYLTHV